MEMQGIHLSWIVVQDLVKALDFYTRVVGLSIKSHSQEHGWAELAGPTGGLLGIAQESPCMENKAGTNAVVTVSVDDIESARDHFLSQGAKLLGEVVEVPGHVKMQTFSDIDGNVMQLVQTLEADLHARKQESCSSCG